MACDKKFCPRAFHDGEPALRENRVDHGVLFRPARGGEGIDLTHFTLKSHPGERAVRGASEGRVSYPRRCVGFELRPGDGLRSFSKSYRGVVPVFDTL